jgi:hypothetical protein
MAHGLQAVLEKVASEHDLEIVSVDNAKLKNYATGNGHAKKPTMARILIDRYPQLQGQLLLVKPKPAWVKAQTSVSRPARKAVWVRCGSPKTHSECCGNYVCRKHSFKHVHDCVCPEVSEFEAKFGFSPYGQPRFKGVCSELVADLEAVTIAGKIPDDNQVDAIWVAHWACANYAVINSPFRMEVAK